MRPSRMVLLIVRNAIVCFLIDLGCICLLLLLLDDDMPARIPQYRPRWQAASAKAEKYVFDRQPWRKEDKAFYMSAPWLKLRKAFLMEHPLCMTCKTEGRIVVATHVHHIKDRKDYPELALDWWNLSPQCCACHSRLHAQRKRKP